MGEMHKIECKKCRIFDSVLEFQQTLRGFETHVHFYVVFPSTKTNNSYIGVKNKIQWNGISIWKLGIKPYYIVFYFKFKTPT